MHSRRLASLLIGAWLAASIFMDFVAVRNFQSVDRFLSEPSAQAADQMQSLGGKAQLRTVLRHHAGELNRTLFEEWEYVQLLLGIVVLAVFIFGHGEPPKAALVVTAAMLLIVAADRFFLTPEITRMGRLLDYPNTPGADAHRFWRLHGAYSGLELLKIGLCAIAAGTLIIRRTDRKKFVREHQRSSRGQSASAATSSHTS